MASDVLTAGRRRSLWLAGAVALLLTSLVNLGILVHHYDGEDYMRGDCPYYYYTAQAMLKGFGVDLSLFLPGGWSKHLDQIAQSASGRPVPKHPVTMPVISLPFIALLGRRGALVFNVVQMTALIAILYALAVRIARPWAACGAVVLTYAASFLPHFLWNYSPDVCATALLAGGVLLVMIAERPWALAAAGLLLGAACTAKYPYLIFLPGAFLLMRRLTIARAAMLAAGMALPLLALMALNTHVFGSPFTTGYDRILTLDRQYQPMVYSQRASFALSVSRFQDGVMGQLFDRQRGLVYTSAITLIAWLGFPFLLRRSPRLAAYIAVGSLILFGAFSTYDQWNASHYGNRFLMPIVALAVLPLAAFLDWAAAWLPRSPSRRTEA